MIPEGRKIDEGSASTLELEKDGNKKQAINNWNKSKLSKVKISTPSIIYRPPSGIFD